MSDAAPLPPRTSSLPSFEPRCGRCSTPAGCSKHGLFTCPTCKRTVRWRDGGAPELDCSDCWYDARAYEPALKHLQREGSLLRMRRAIMRERRWSAVQWHEAWQATDLPAECEAAARWLREQRSTAP